MYNKDIWYNILLNSNIKELDYLCYTNKDSIDICSDKQFWLDKFLNDNLPYLVKVFPKNISKMINEYEKIYTAQSTAIKLTNSILRDDKYQNTQLQITENNLRKMSWLPAEIVKQLKSIPRNKWKNIDFNSFLYFNINKNPKSFNITFELSREDIKWDDEEASEEELEITTVNLSKDEFILYLTKLFYTQPQVEIYMDDDWYPYETLTIEPIDPYIYENFIYWDQY